MPPGRFSLDYEAAVTLDPHRADPAGIGETPVKDLPLAILPYLLPSRFVSSDASRPSPRRSSATSPRASSG